jgi:hypothetical protein
MILSLAISLSFTFMSFQRCLYYNTDNRERERERVRESNTESEREKERERERESSLMARRWNIKRFATRHVDSTSLVERSSTRDQALDRTSSNTRQRDYSHGLSTTHLRRDDDAKRVGVGGWGRFVTRLQLLLWPVLPGGARFARLGGDCPIWQHWL